MGTKKMKFKISTLEKKNVSQIEVWTKNGVTLTHTIGWRWGWATLKEKPDLSNYNESEGINIYDFDLIDQDLDDGVWEDYDYSSETNPDNVKVLEEEVDIFLEENGYIIDLDELGWENIDTELRFSGPLEVEEVE